MVRTSSICESVTKEESGFRGAIGIGGKPVLGSMISQTQETCVKTSDSLIGSGPKGGDRAEGGKAGARGHWMAQSLTSALTDFFFKL